MANRYFAGNSLAAFFRDTTTVAEVTTSGWFDSAYVANAIALTPNTATLTSSSFAATGTVWVRFDYRTGSGTGTSFAPMTAYNGTTPVFRLIGGATLDYKCQYWNGTSWVTTGSEFSTARAARVTFAVKINLNSGFEVYVGGSLVASGSGWTGGQTSMTKVVFAADASSSNSCGVSQVMIADYDLRDSHFMPAALNGNSATNTGGTGAYTDINETVLDESTAVKVSTSGNKQGQTKASITVPAGYIIAAMVISARGRVSGAITDGKLGVRTSGGTNSSGSGLSYNGGYEPRQRIIDNDPDTATNFTQAGFNGAEIYEEAA